MKKTISLLTALIMFVSALCLQGFSAYAEDCISTGLQKNPFYAHREIASTSLDEVKLYESVSRTYNNKTYYSDGSGIYKNILTAFQNRSAKTTIYYLSKTKLNSASKITAAVDAFISAATDDSYNSTATGGDYQRWSMEYWAADVREDFNKSPYYYYTFDFEFSYFDTAAQEKQVNTVVNNFVNGIDTDSMSDYEILKSVHDFICDNTTYCDDAVNDYSAHKYAFSAYGALVKGSCVCQGYSLAFYRLCEELGYNARILTSDYFSPYSLSWEGHAWNLVELNGKYYFVDATWDDTDDQRDYSYFLVNTATIRDDDSLDEHCPEEKYYDGEYYNTTYAEKIDDINYDSQNGFLLSNCAVSLEQGMYVWTGKSHTPAVCITNKNGEQLTDGDFTVSYSGGKNTGLATVTVKGAGDFAGSISHRQFYVYPAKANKLSLASGGRNATSLKLSWKASDGAVSGYKIEHYSGDKWSVVATVTGASATSATVTSLSPAASHKFRIRAYKTVSKRQYYGDYSAVFTTCTIPKTPALTLKTAGKTVTASWKKLACTGYEVQLCTNNKFKSKVKKYTLKQSATSKKITSLKSGEKYFVRIRAYKVISGKKYYSPWKVKSVKCK